MPTCASESLAGGWPSDESLSSGFHSPGSLSPASTSPNNTLKKGAKLRRTSSSGSFVIRSDRRAQSPARPKGEEEEEEDANNNPWWAIGWYPLLLLRVAKALVLATLPRPTFWLSLWWWCFWHLARLPLTVIQCLWAGRNRKRRRTVLISGGSTVQAVHLARNFYSAGARVIVCEVEGCFSLARFSTAVSRCYAVPKPSNRQQQNYVRALCEIAHRECATYYIPVAGSTPAYYDAVAKPHLELLGCAVFAPGIKEVRALDDILEVFKRCRANDLPLPPHHTLTDSDALGQLHAQGVIRPEHRYVMHMAGACGIRERVKLPLGNPPPPKVEDISEQRPWVLVQDVDGEHFVTCTMVKESRLIANVSCRYDHQSSSLQPLEAPEVEAWLRAFFAQLRPFTGHVSFRLVRCARTRRVLPLSARVGVGAPYVCYTSVHARLLWKPCRHFSRQLSGPVVAEAGAHYMPETVMAALKRPSLEAVTRLLGTVLDKREALFALWDPLPYCVYYHVQLPLGNFLAFVRRLRASAAHFAAPLTAN